MTKSLQNLANHVKLQPPTLPGYPDRHTMLDVDVLVSLATRIKSSIKVLNVNTIMLSNRVSHLLNTDV
ncbi:hypothetical protein CCR75_003947 [Bremia lactucae]|uniref:Uncharacterized protein n=1 Tax=Bremia lactucae TaxID=4779 RepID=A0A976IF25_BRELC|nr:hypothetical protein CCR75_003947 [Bremia lactucae]